MLGAIDDDGNPRHRKVFPKGVVAIVGLYDL
jgi:hypothetical protein